jgi:hypothetical protein
VVFGNYSIDCGQVRDFWERDLCPLNVTENVSFAEILGIGGEVRGVGLS